jgi:hypothetical protein
MGGEPVEPLGPPPSGDGRPLPLDELPQHAPPIAPPASWAPVGAASEAAEVAPGRTYDDVPDFMGWVGQNGVATPAEFEFADEQELRTAPQRVTFEHPLQRPSARPGGIPQPPPAQAAPQYPTLGAALRALWRRPR